MVAFDTAAAGAVNGQQAVLDMHISDNIHGIIGHVPLDLQSACAFEGQIAGMGHDMVDLAATGQLDSQIRKGSDCHGVAAVFVVTQRQHAVLIVSVVAAGGNGGGNSVLGVAAFQEMTGGQDHVMEHDELTDGQIVIGFQSINGQHLVTLTGGFIAADGRQMICYDKGIGSHVGIAVSMCFRRGVAGRDHTTGEVCHPCRDGADVCRNIHNTAGYRQLIGV